MASPKDTVRCIVVSQSFSLVVHLVPTHALVPTWTAHDTNSSCGSAALCRGVTAVLPLEQTPPLNRTWLQNVEQQHSILSSISPTAFISEFFHIWSYESWFIHSSVEFNTNPPHGVNFSLALAFNFPSFAHLTRLCGATQRQNSISSTFNTIWDSLAIKPSPRWMTESGCCGRRICLIESAVYLQRVKLTFSISTWCDPKHNWHSTSSDDGLLLRDYNWKLWHLDVDVPTMWQLYWDQLVEYYLGANENRFSSLWIHCTSLLSIIGIKLN